jgi:transposase-like protein
MKTSEAIAFFGGNVSELARAADVHQSTVYSWGDYPPGPRQLLLERKTKGRLKAERDCMLPKPRKEKA